MAYKNVEDERACWRRYYARKKSFVKGKIRERKQEIETWFWEYKSHLSCRKCGESHPECLHFHHRNPETKLFEVGRGVHNGKSISTILAEIEKCDVLCANCHAKHHFCGVHGLVIGHGTVTPDVLV